MDGRGAASGTRVLRQRLVAMHIALEGTHMITHPDKPITQDETSGVGATRDGSCRFGPGPCRPEAHLPGDPAAAPEPPGGDPQMAQRKEV